MKRTCQVSVITSVLNGDRYLPHFLRNIEQQSNFGEIELVLHLSSPSSFTQELAYCFAHQHPEQTVIIESEQPVSLPRAWNDAVRASSGRHIAIWNVDDARTSHSLRVQSEALIDSPGALVAWGPFRIVGQLGGRSGPLRGERVPSSRKLAKGMHFGPFMMFLRDAVAKVGCFDEQLVSGADYDFAVRLALAGEAVHVPEVLGYFLDEGLGASTRKGSLQRVERTVVELRYGHLSSLDLSLVPLAMKYRLDHIMVNGEWIALETIVTDYHKGVDKGLHEYATSLRFKTLSQWGLTQDRIRSRISLTPFRRRSS